MSRIDALIEELCPNGVPYRVITDVTDYVRGITYSKSDEDPFGEISVLRANNITLASNTLNFNDIKRISGAVPVRDNQRLRAGDILICAGSGSKEHIGKVAYIYSDMEETFGGFMAVVRVHESAGLHPRFVFHLLAGGAFSTYLRGALLTTTINNLNVGVMRGFRIPVPPIEVQREIVRVLDKFIELEAELNAELEARRRQYEHFLHSLTNPFGVDGAQKPGWSSTTLGDACRVEKGATPIQKAVPGAYPLIVTAVDRRSSADFQFDSDAVCIPLISSKGHGVASISRVYFQSGKFALGNILAAAVPLKPSELSAEFLYRYLETRKDFLLVPLMRGGANVSLTVDALKSVRVFFPSPHEQKRVTTILRQVELLTGDESGGLLVELAARRKQYDYYRNKLLDFAETAA
jgi:type I restriction enzyme S subunit